MHTQVTCAPPADHRVPPPGRQRRLGRSGEQHPIIFDQGSRPDIDQPRAVLSDRTFSAFWRLTRRRCRFRTAEAAGWPGWIGREPGG
jgi:hypothetical protein